MRISDWSSDVCSSDLSVILSHPRTQSASAAGAMPVVIASLNATHGMKYSGVIARCAPLSRANVKNDRLLAIAVDTSKIGRESCRERVLQDGEISVVAVYLKKK